MSPSAPAAEDSTRLLSLSRSQVQEKGKIAELNKNLILYTGSGELSCSAGSFGNIYFIRHWDAHNSVLLLDSLHGRNSQTQLAPLLFL